MIFLSLLLKNLLLRCSLALLYSFVFIFYFSAGKGKLLMILAKSFIACLIIVAINWKLLQIIEKGETRCLFLIKQGVHCIGMWKYECRCEASASSTSLHCSRFKQFS